MKPISKMASNTLFIFLDWFFVTLFSFIYRIAAGKLLIPHEYGVAIVTIQFVALISTFSTLGLTIAIQKLVSEYYATRKYKYAFGAIKYSLKIILLINIPVSIIVFFLSPFIASVIFNDVQLVQPIRIASVGVLFFSMVAFTYSLLIGLQKMKLLFVTDFIGNFVKILIAIALILFGFSFFGPIIGAVSGLFLIIILRLKSIKLKGKAYVPTNKVWGYALPAFVGLISLALLNQTGPIFLSSLSSTTAAGLFSLAFAITAPLFAISHIFMYSSFPIFSGMYGQKDKSGIEKLLPVVIKYMLFLSILAVLFFLIFPNFLILLLGRAEYLGAITTLRILSIAFLIFGVGNVLLNTLYAVGKPKISRNIFIATAITFILLATFLAITLSAKGVAIAYLISVSLLFSLSLFFIKKFYTFRFSPLLLVKIFLSGLLTAIFLIFLKLFVQNIILLVFGIIASFGIYLFLAIIFKFFNKSDLVMLDKIRKTLPKRLSKIIYSFESMIERFL